MSDLAGAIWRKSSRSAEGNCVEVADNLPSLVGVRDSKDPDGPALTFSPTRWMGFVRTVKASALDQTAG